MTDRQTFIPIETELGVLQDRTSLYLDALEYELNGILRLKGGFSEQSAESEKRVEKNYVFTFIKVVAYQVIEIDNWIASGGYSESCFDEVINSAWLAQLGPQTPGICKHYFLLTYDHVIQIVCAQFRLEITDA